MTASASSPSDPSSPTPVDIPLKPEFSLSVFDDGADGAGLEISILSHPSVKRHASPGLLYGLAIMTLDQQGTINAMVETLLAAGPISEVDASNRITLLLKQDANVEPV